MSLKFTSTLGLVRSILALSSLMVHLFNDLNQMVPAHHFEYLLTEQKMDSVNKLNLFLLFDYGHLYMAKLISIGVLLLVLSGYYPRWTCLLHSWVAYSLYNSYLIVEGGDQINSIIAMLLIPVCLMDGRKNHWQDGLEINNKHLAYIAVLFIAIIRIQMAVIYLDAGIEKFKVEEWADGTALYYWFNHNIFGLPAEILPYVNNIFSHKWIMVITTWSVMILEILLFAGLFATQPVKYLLFLIGAFFHFMIIVVHGLPSFFMAMLSGLIIYLWDFNLPVSENLKALRVAVNHKIRAAVSF